MKNEATPHSSRDFPIAHSKQEKARSSRDFPIAHSKQEEARSSRDFPIAHSKQKEALRVAAISQSRTVNSKQ